MGNPQPTSQASDRPSSDDDQRVQDHPRRHRARHRRVRIDHTGRTEEVVPMECPMDKPKICSRRIKWAGAMFDVSHCPHFLRASMAFDITSHVITCTFPEQAINGKEYKIPVKKGKP